MHDAILAEKFTAAYNTHDLDGLAELIAMNATAEVLGSGFPVENGREQIRTTSLPHILEGGTPLVAETWQEDDRFFVLLRERDGNRGLDTAIRLFCDGAAIQRLEYLVLWSRQDELARIAAEAGMELCAVPDDESEADVAD